jgi:hypothetical protein
MLLACGSMLGQSSQSSSPAGGQAAGMPSEMHMGSAQNAEGMADMKNHKEQMQREMQEFKSRIEKMRSEAEKVRDPNTKAALLDNVEMWEQFMHQMQAHMEMMTKGGGMHGKGMMSEKCDMMMNGNKPQTSQPGTGTAAPK